MDSVFILEDDVDFAEDFRNKLGICLSELPEDWDGIHLGGYSPHGSNKHYSIHLNRCFASWGGYGYIVNKRIIPTLIELISQEKMPVDTYYARFMPQMNWYKTKEMLVKHLAGHSTIQNKFVDYKDLY